MSVTDVRDKADVNVGRSSVSFTWPMAACILAFIFGMGMWLAEKVTSVEGEIRLLGAKVENVDKSLTEVKTDLKAHLNVKPDK